MLSVALRTLRTRWATFTGSFVALSLGVALLTVTGLALASSAGAPQRAPERFAAAPVVVKAQDTLRAPTPAGDRVSRLAHPRPLPATTVAEVRKLGPVVADRSFAVRVTKATDAPTDLVGHPWSSAAFAPYDLATGRAPRTAGEVAVTGDWTRPGQRLHTDRGPVRVVGTLTSRGFENAVFFTDARAARLAPAVPQLAVEADPAAVREAVGDTAQVLTGAARRLADADPGRDGEALTAMNSLFGTAGGVTAFVSVFVVASTFAFAVAQRRREFALLRTAGATPGQIRRTVLVGALAVGTLASAAGCALGSHAAPRLAAWVVGNDLAPAWFTIGDHTWPYHAAFWTGLLVALCGATAASWRAGRTGPTEALREAAAESGTLTRGRLLSGTALLLAAAVTLGLSLAGDPADLLHRKTYISRPMLLITAAALLSPLVLRPLTRLLTWLPGPCALLVRENTAAGMRRTAALAAPVLVTVALAGSLLGATATLNRAQTAETSERTTAAFVVTPPAGTGFDAAALRRLRAVPGTEMSPTSSTAVHVLEDGVALIRSEARAAAPGPLAATTRLPLAAGAVGDLDDDSIIVNEEWQRHRVGDRVRIWLGDGTPRTLRIAAVMPTGTGDNGVYVTPRNAPGATVDRIDVALAAGADPKTVATALHQALGTGNGQVLTRAEWIRATHPETQRTTRLGLLLVLGIALLYTGISVANTMVMATSDRARDLAVLRLAGATRWQVLRLTGAEALTVVAAGALLGLLVAAVNLAGMAGALALLSAPVTVELPWQALGTTTAVCALLAVTSALTPAALALRRRPAELAGVRE
ncbi:putative ABC transport system permease protein [Streptomyces africanus]|uniref:ABC transport system permease protein n=1 Tax=Streptomyces africanus TaxID=231024 RepID=A0ABU0QS62_9ACTN|nr:FtsX-like permease family protein [Streptomyces africanus]MDQ0749815.1 putative ABC transport system permease protein [Streptomyces africanus]